MSFQLAADIRRKTLNGGQLATPVDGDVSNHSGRVGYAGLEMYRQGWGRVVCPTHGNSSILGHRLSGNPIPEAKLSVNARRA